MERSRLDNLFYDCQARGRRFETDHPLHKFSTTLRFDKEAAMPSLVEELQESVLNSNVPVSALLRRAKVIAYKLDLPELLETVQEIKKGGSIVCS